MDCNSLIAVAVVLLVCSVTVSRYSSFLLTSPSIARDRPSLRASFALTSAKRSL